MTKVKLEKALTVAIDGYKITTYDAGLRDLPEEAVEAMIQQGKGEIIVEPKEVKISEYELLKKEAFELGLDVKGNVSKKDLKEMIAEAKEAE